MVKDFPFDILHLAFLGIMKKMLTEHWLVENNKLSTEKLLLCVLDY